MSCGPLPLPSLPDIRLSVVRDRSADASATGGFFDVHRLDFVASYQDGTVSEPFDHDVGHRKALDAVTIAAYFVKDDRCHVFLRSCLRPALTRRHAHPHQDGGLWEMPAGLIEPGEDPASAAARELKEELGFSATPNNMRPLGDWTFPAPAIIGERLFFFAVNVDPQARQPPTEDGSFLERHGVVASLRLTDVVEHFRRGTLRDAKTELAARRLMDAWADAWWCGPSATAEWRLRCQCSGCTLCLTVATGPVGPSPAYLSPTTGRCLRVATCSGPDIRCYECCKV